MTGFAVSVTLILSGRDFDPILLGALKDRAERIWKIGDSFSPGMSKVHDDSGVEFRLLRSCAEYDWLEQMRLPLHALCTSILEIGVVSRDLVPQLSLYVETDGSSFPPIFFTRATLQLLSDVGAELDIDVIRTLRRQPSS
jgi:hypothetical protein